MATSSDPAVLFVIPGTACAAVFEKDGTAAGLTATERDACGRSCPRHFFSSHSTHNVRPADTGNPQASHLRNWRNTGGTWLWSLSSTGLKASGSALSVADQNRGFLGGAIVSEMAGTIF